ncbi:MAG: hypothetical protein A2Y34_08140 [Spirochaetes bacterium GWC1_27_15]|nr:MAG: hypothetical protein A2Z98_04125 [Spirochaetes bacterium GWB1_27_13]OHD20011.1 MAG: hypothetical protein A2Y34_08140 [Spirochaetes bacterium GWC1_27_15]
MSNDNIDNETKEVIDSFVSEGFDLLEKADSKIINLDKSQNEEIVNTIFRLFHSLKGSAGYLNFENIKKVTHEAETLLDVFRKENKKPTQQQIDLLYQTSDFIKQLLESVEKRLTDRGFEEETTIMVNDINECIANLKDEIEEGLSVKEFKDNKLETENLVTNEMIENFISESIDLIDSVEHKIISFEDEPANKDIILDIYRNIHTFKGNSGFFGYEDLEEISMRLENVFDDLRNNKITINHNLISSFLKEVDTIRNRLIEISIKFLNKGLNFTKKIKDEKKEISKYPKKIGEILVEIGEATKEVIDEAIDLQTKPIGEILIETGKVSKDAVDKALDIQKITNQAMTSTSQAIQRKDVRVDMTKLDKLFDLVGEIITAGSMVTNNPDLKGLKLDNFAKSVNIFNKITRELQEVTTTIRMIPLEGLFTKMVRLVRDLSRKFNKKINFSVYGQETEMDRNVIEEISDPLVHLLRNSIDHGIESDELRKHRGKEEAGNIELGAKYEGNEVWIIIKDDGAGLDRDKIIKKAIEKNLLIKEESDKLSNDEVWKIIFEPGFSTSDKITEISGRGVGMDVVRKNIEKLRGKIDIKTEKYRGTTIILRIPLTLAILEGVTFKVGNNFYSIPTVDILEFFKAKDNQIVVTEGNNLLLKLRNEILPVIKLHEIFKINTDIKNITDGIILVIQANDKKVCLLIDEIIGSQQLVIKSLSGYLGDINGISGCSIMGNGDVSLIIDTHGLISLFVE